MRSSNSSRGITERSNSLCWIRRVEPISLRRNSGKDTTTKGILGLAGVVADREGISILADGKG